MVYPLVHSFFPKCPYLVVIKLSLLLAPNPFHFTIPPNDSLSKNSRSLKKTSNLLGGSLGRHFYHMEGESQKLLTHAIQNMHEFRTNILVFETKMRALMHECKVELIKRAGNSEKNNSMGWMKASHTFSKESSSRAVITMKARVVEAGIQLSNLVIDFVIMMSRRDELEEKIGKFKAAFKWAIESKLNSTVIYKVVNLLEMADRELRKMRRSEELTNKGKLVIDDGNRNERSIERI